MIEYCGGTEIGGGYITGTVIQDAALSMFSAPALGMSFVITDGKELLATEEDEEEEERTRHDSNHGELFLLPPALGLSEMLVTGDHEAEYYQHGCNIDGYTCLRRHGDYMKIIGKGYFQAIGRADDTMNLAGIKVGSVELERCLAQHPAIMEIAAIGFNPSLGGQTMLVVFVVIKASTITAATPQMSTTFILKSELQQLLREKMNPLLKLHDVVIVESLPKTASHKVMRRSLRNIYFSK